MSATYTRNVVERGVGDMPNARRDRIVPRFHIETVLDQAASDIAGRPVFRDEERVQYLMAGHLNQPVERVTDEHRRRWPDEYKQFKATGEMLLTGMPVEHWAMLTRAQAIELKALGVHTVEQVADLSDALMHRLNTGGRKLKNAAIAFLDDAEANKLVTQLTDQNTRFEQRNTELEQKLDIQAKAIEALQAQLLMANNAQPAAHTYVPAQHDPLAQAIAAAPPATIAAPALDSFAEPVRRGPGRPRKVLEDAA